MASSGSSAAASAEATVSHVTMPTAENERTKLEEDISTIAERVSMAEHLGWLVDPRGTSEESLTLKARILETIKTDEETRCPRTMERFEEARSALLEDRKFRVEARALRRTDQATKCALTGSKKYYKKVKKERKILEDLLTKLLKSGPHEQYSAVADYASFNWRAFAVQDSLGKLYGQGYEGVLKSLTPEEREALTRVVGIHANESTRC